MNKKCACGTFASKRCSRCHAVSYCSRKCQRQDWKQHKLVCVIVKSLPPKRWSRPAEAWVWANVSEFLLVDLASMAMEYLNLNGLDLVPVPLDDKKIYMNNVAFAGDILVTKGTDEKRLSLINKNGHISELEVPAFQSFTAFENSIYLILLTGVLTRLDLDGTPQCSSSSNLVSDASRHLAANAKYVLTHSFTTGYVRVWDAKTLHRFHSFALPKRPTFNALTRNALFGEDCAYFMSLAGTSFIIVNIQTGQVLKTVSLQGCHKERVIYHGLHNEELFVNDHFANTLSIFSLDGELLATKACNEDFHYFCSNGQRIVARRMGADDGFIQLQ